MYNKTKDGGWPCPCCGELFRTRKLMYLHRNEVHMDVKKHTAKLQYNDYVCQYCGKEMHTLLPSFKSHETYCLHNPNKKVRNFDSQRTPEYRQKCAERQKLRHKLGLAKGFPNRKHAKHSYSELWVIGLLKNEYDMVENVHYRTEMPFHQFFLDFAWPDKRLCIEVDGNQHLMPERKAKDDIKDALLRNEGWKILRIKWGFIVSHKQDTKEYIDKFLKETGDVTIPIYVPKKMQNKNRNHKIKSNGIYSNPGYSTVNWDVRKDILLNCGVDFSKKGSVCKAEQVTGIPKYTIFKIIRRFPDAFANKYHHSVIGNGKCRSHRRNKNKLIDRRISNEEYQRRWDIIKGSGEDLTTWGWKTRVSRKTGLSRDIINAVLQHFHLEYEAMFM